MSLWLCPVCQGIVRCPIGNVCPACGSFCERVKSIEYISAFDKKIAEFAEELVLSFNSYVNHTTYYNLDEIRQTIIETANKHSISNLEFSLPRINGDELTFTLSTYEKVDKKAISLKFNLALKFFTLNVQ